MLSSAKWAVGTVLVITAGCGARTGLPLPGASSDAGSREDASITDGGADTATIPTDAATDAPAEVRCFLQPAGPSTILGSFPDQHAEAPSLAVVDRGTPDTPANVVLQTYRSGGSDMEHAIFAGRFEVGAAWPDAVTMTQPLSKVGTDSHGWAVMTRAPGSLRQVALGWYGDPGMVGRTMFRSIDVDTWTLHDAVDLSFDGGGSALSIAAGAATGDNGAGYGGEGYGLVWRMDDWTTPEATSFPVVAVLDVSGEIRLGPHAVTGGEDYPGRAPSIAWSGSTYLLANSFAACAPGDALCAANSVVIARLRPASGDAEDDSGVEQVSIIPALSSDWMPRRAWIDSDGLDTFVAWSEGPIDSEDNIRTIRLARLDSGGALQETRIVAQDVPLLQSVRLEVTPFGVAVVWAEEGNTELTYNDVGRSRMAVYLSDRSLEQNGSTTRFDTTQFGSYGWASGVSIDHPRGLLLTWPGYPLQGGMEVSWLARLDCVEEPAPDAGPDTGPDAATNADYFAGFGPIGALDRMFVAKRDYDRDLCFRVGLASPSDFGPFDIATPYPWTVESAVVVQGVANCEQPAWSEGAVSATSATGLISFHEEPGEWMPCAVDIDATLIFEDDLPWTPESEVVFAKDVPVQGACGGDD
jgi:hypothetical protein